MCKQVNCGHMATRILGFHPHDKATNNNIKFPAERQVIVLAIQHGHHDVTWQPALLGYATKRCCGYVASVARMTQLVEHRAAMWEAVSSTPTGPTLRVFE